jgi:type I restriction-modification system DNA methylase subunit
MDRASLGGLIDLKGTIALGNEQAKSKDVLGQVYEYFLGQFALAEGKKGGQFYTPRSMLNFWSKYRSHTKVVLIATWGIRWSALIENSQLG